MPPYDSDEFDPPAPVAFVTLRNPDTRSGLDNVLMLIDSGADVTLIPKEVASQLGIVAATEAQYALEGFDGTQSVALAVRAELKFLRRTFRGQFLLTDKSIGVIGRNVLNSLRLVLDGPRLSWDEA